VAADKNMIKKTGRLFPLVILASLVIAWVLFLAISIGFVTTSIGEGETNAAFYGAVFGSVIAVVSGVVVWRLIKI
jgi:membrane associated rhomboid family serine protease